MQSFEIYRFEISQLSSRHLASSKQKCVRDSVLKKNLDHSHHGEACVVNIIVSKLFWCLWAGLARVCVCVCGAQRGVAKFKKIGMVTESMQAEHIRQCIATSV